MAFELPPLPYEKDALAPYISAETLDYHHGKHHNAYVTNLNGLIEGTEHADASLEDIIKNSDGGLFNNAAQVWNHTFYWNCMAPGGGGEPSGEIADAIGSAFGSYDAFREQFTTAAKTQFGSGWAWLVDAGSGLEIMKTANADLRHDARREGAAHHRRVGARLLHRLPQRPPRLHRDVHEQPAQLGSRRRPDGLTSARIHGQPIDAGSRRAGVVASGIR